MVIAAITLMQPALASTYASETAKYLTYLTDIKAQILSVLNGTLKEQYVGALASVIYDTQNLQASLYELLASWKSYGDTSLIDISEFLASQLASIQEIKADVLSILSQSDTYIQSLANYMIYEMKILAKLMEVLATT